MNTMMLMDICQLCTPSVIAKLRECNQGIGRDVLADIPLVFAINLHRSDTIQGSLLPPLPQQQQSQYLGNINTGYKDDEVEEKEKVLDEEMDQHRCQDTEAFISDKNHNNERGHHGEGGSDEPDHGNCTHDNSATNYYTTPMWRVPMTGKFIDSGVVFPRTTYVSSLEVNLDQIGRRTVILSDDVGNYKNASADPYVHWSGVTVSNNITTNTHEDGGEDVSREVLSLRGTFLRGVCTSTVHPGKVGGGIHMSSSGGGMTSMPPSGGSNNYTMMMAQQMRMMASTRAKHMAGSRNGDVCGGESLFVEWMMLRDRRGRVEVLPNEFLSGNTFRYLHFDGFANLTTIGNGFLRGNSLLERIVFPPSLSSVTTIEYDFLAGCGGLISVDLRGLTGVTRLGSNFVGGCESLASIDLRPFGSKLNPLDAHSMRCFLWGCDSLRKIHLYRCQSWIFDSKNSPAHQSNMSIKMQMSFLIFDDALD